MTGCHLDIDIVWESHGSGHYLPLKLTYTPTNKTKHQTKSRVLSSPKIITLYNSHNMLQLSSILKQPTEHPLPYGGFCLHFRASRI